VHEGEASDRFHTAQLRQTEIDQCHFRPQSGDLAQRLFAMMSGCASDAILDIIGAGESAEPTDIARNEQEYLAEAYAPAQE
jgi:hypothetical protein